MVLTKNEREEFVKYYNYERYHESIQNLTPACLSILWQSRKEAEKARKHQKQNIKGKKKTISEKLINFELTLS